MLAPESEVLPGQVSSRLFGGLKSGGGSVRDLHLHLHAAGLGYCCGCCLPRSPCVSPFKRRCYQSLPKGRMPVVHLAWAPGRTVWPRREVCVCAGAEVASPALAPEPHRQPVSRTIGLRRNVVLGPHGLCLLF